MSWGRRRCGGRWSQTLVCASPFLNAANPFTIWLFFAQRCPFDMPDDSSFSRLDIAQWIGTLLWIVLLGSHVISRPLVFLLGPVVMLLCTFLIGSPIDSQRLRR